MITVVHYMPTVLSGTKGARSAWCRALDSIDEVSPLKGMPFNPSEWWDVMLMGYSHRCNRPVLWIPPTVLALSIVMPEDWPPEVCVAVALEALTEGEKE